MERFDRFIFIVWIGGSRFACARDISLRRVDEQGTGTRVQGIADADSALKWLWRLAASRR
jgi:hypothetical protein